MFKTQDLKIVKKILTFCYLGDWWVLYQLGRNSNTHFFRYLLRHIEHDFALKEKRALREERRRHRRPPGKLKKNSLGYHWLTRELQEVAKIKPFQGSS